MISRLHYITPDLPIDKLPKHVREICKSGVYWIQLRVKNVRPELFRKQAIEIRDICTEYRCEFIVNDHVELAKEIDADGVHLGKTDTPIAKAREILGEQKIIGATANDLADIENAIRSGADYIGLGPLRDTKTKKNLSPIIGSQGIKKMISKLNAKLPIVIIGGVTAKDCRDMVKSGAHGVAISSALAYAKNKLEIVTSFKKGLFTVG